MEFLVLGPLEVRDGDRPVPLGGLRQRALLAILLTRANEVVSRDSLVDELWGDSSPETATNVLQGYISHLRKAVGTDVLQTRAPGYVAVVAATDLDLRRFEELLERGSVALTGGDAAAAGQDLREALGLWRGPALADFAYEPFAQAEIARLEGLRLTALERRIEADLALGREGESIGELEALVAKHPLRERFRALLMLALYRAGRQAEALEAYQQARYAFVDELGIDPSPALQELERAILRQDPSLDLAPTSVPPADIVEPRPERGSIIVVPADPIAIDSLLSVAEPLARNPPRELIMALLLAGEDSLWEASALLESRRADLGARGISARAAAFTTRDRGDDLTILVAEQDADLLLVDAPAGFLRNGELPEELSATLAAMPCDVGILVPRESPPREDGPVVVPLRVDRHDTRRPASPRGNGSRARCKQARRQQVARARGADGAAGRGRSDGARPRLTRGFRDDRRCR